MNIVVTGHSGFVGRNLAKKLSNEDYNVIGIDIIKSNIKSIKEKIVDIRNLEELEESVDWDKVDFIYHLAAVANLNYAKEFKRETFDINVLGTFNIYQIANKYNIPVCYISTQCVYGNQDTFPVREDKNIPNPTEIYGATKYMGEQIIKLLPKWVILRYGTIFGPDMRKALATYIFLDKAIKKETIPIFGTGEQTRNWIYIDDLVDATAKVVKLWNRRNLNKQIINIAGNKSYSVLEMAKMVWYIVNNNSNIKYKLLEGREGEILIEETSIEKAKHLLDWEPKVSLFDGLKKCYEAWMK